MELKFQKLDGAISHAKNKKIEILLLDLMLHNQKNHHYLLA